MSSVALAKEDRTILSPLYDADGVTTKYAYDAAGRLVKEGNKTYSYGYLDKVLSVTEGANAYTYDYHVDGQLARASYGDDGRARTPAAPQMAAPAATEDFLWDGLALIRRGDERFVNEPHVGGGNPVISSKGTTYFNDLLGTTVGAKTKGKYSAAALTAFGEPLPGGVSRHSLFPRIVCYGSRKNYCYTQFCWRLKVC